MGIQDMEEIRPKQGEKSKPESKTNDRRPTSQVSAIGIYVICCQFGVNMLRSFTCTGFGTSPKLVHVEIHPFFVLYKN